MSSSSLDTCNVTIPEAEEFDHETHVVVINHRSILAGGLRDWLEGNGFPVSMAADAEAIDANCALVLLNLAHLDLEGLRLIRRIRHKSNIPLLMLVERGNLQACLAGLGAGANDYLTGPFSSSVLLTRVKEMILHHGGSKAPSRLCLFGLEVDLVRHRCSRNGVELDLTDKEFELLLVMLRNQGKVLSRSQLAEQVWGMKFDGKTNVIEVTILRLRKKIDAPFEVKLLHTVRGGGYVLEERFWSWSLYN